MQAHKTMLEKASEMTESPLVRRAREVMRDLHGPIAAARMTPAQAVRQFDQYTQAWASGFAAAVPRRL